MKWSKIVLSLAGCLAWGFVHAQNPGGNYKSNKKAITQEYMDEVKSIAAQRNISPQEKRKQRDEAIKKYRSEKRSNRVAFRRSVDHNRSAFEKKNKGYVPRLHKN